MRKSLRTIGAGLAALTLLAGCGFGAAGPKQISEAELNTQLKEIPDVQKVDIKRDGNTWKIQVKMDRRADVENIKSVVKAEGNFCIAQDAGVTCETTIWDADLGEAAAENPAHWAIKHDSDGKKNQLYSQCVDGYEKLGYATRLIITMSGEVNCDVIAEFSGGISSADTGNLMRYYYTFPETVETPDGSIAVDRKFGNNGAQYLMIKMRKKGEE